MIKWLRLTQLAIYQDQSATGIKRNAKFLKSHVPLPLLFFVSPDETDSITCVGEWTLSLSTQSLIIHTIISQRFFSNSPNPYSPDHHYFPFCFPSDTPLIVPTLAPHH